VKREILNRALSGNRFNDLHIIDCHCHMGPWYSFYFPRAEIEEMIHDADILGVEKLCIAPHVSISCDYKLGNRQVANAVCKFPERVWALLVLNPNKPCEIQEEFTQYYYMKNFIGVKIHPYFHKYNVSGENYFMVYDKVKQYGGYILSHTNEGHANEECSYCNTTLCEEVIKAYPMIPFILGHSACYGIGVEKSIQLVNKFENAYMDTSGFECSDIWIEEIANKADRTKILFGSDFPFFDLRGGISRILFSDMDDDIKIDILSRNFRKMLLKYPKKSG